jgi:MarR family transcriptional repressor of emrRAB
MSLSSSANGARSPIADVQPRKGAAKETDRPSSPAVSPSTASLAIALVLRACHLHLMDALRLALHNSDVTTSQYFLLCCLLGRPERRASPSELAHETGETRSNTTRLCEAFVQRGWLQRAYSAGDRRRVDMSLTHAGAKVAEGLIAKVREHEGSAEALLSAAEYAETLRVLTRLATALAGAQ